MTLCESTNLLIKVRLIHIPDEQREPLHSVDVIHSTDMLIDSVYVTKPIRNPFGIMTWAEAEDVRREIPVPARICVARCHTRRNDDVFAIQSACGGG